MVSQWGIEPHRLTLVSSPTCGARWGFPQGIFDEPEGADGDFAPGPNSRKQPAHRPVEGGVTSGDCLGEGDVLGERPGPMKRGWVHGLRQNYGLTVRSPVGLNY